MRGDANCQQKSREARWLPLFGVSLGGSSEHAAGIRFASVDQPPVLVLWLDPRLYVRADGPRRFAWHVAAESAESPSRRTARKSREIFLLPAPISSTLEAGVFSRRSSNSRRGSGGSWLVGARAMQRASAPRVATRGLPDKNRARGQILLRRSQSPRRPRSAPSETGRHALRNGSQAAREATVLSLSLRGLGVNIGIGRVHEFIGSLASYVPERRSKCSRSKSSSSRARRCSAFS